MNVTPCRSCRAPMVYLPTTRGKQMPVNRSFFTSCMTDAEFDAAPAPTYEHKVHNAFVHWATCPHAVDWRRDR
jgi:hypothetical protein